MTMIVGAKLISEPLEDLIHIYKFTVYLSRNVINSDV